jgi:hypothetical protein
LGQKTKIPTCLSKKPQRLEMEFYDFCVEQAEVVGNLTVFWKGVEDLLELWKRGSDIAEYVQQLIVSVVVVACNLDAKSDVGQ